VVLLDIRQIKTNQVGESIAGIIGMISVAIYWVSKIFFMVMGIFYLYALFNGELDTFSHVAGTFGILFLISSIIWYSGYGKS